MFLTILPAFLTLIFVSGLLAIILSWASKKFKVQQDPKIDDLIDALPGANCGGCGFTGCAAFAKNLIKGTDALCPVTDNEAKLKISKILGAEFKETEAISARIFCSGTCDNAKIGSEYIGVEDCRAAKAIEANQKTCTYSCYGLGTCKSVCPFGAIKIENGLAVILIEKCVACGKCIDACPQNIIRIVPTLKTTTIACSSNDKGAIAKNNCKVACIACMRCVKECPEKAISINNSLATIDYSKCINCGKCIAVCPMKTIREVA